MRQSTAGGSLPAIAGFERQSAHSSLLAEPRFELARLRWAIGERDGQVLELADAAAEAWATEPSMRDELEEARTWLEARDAALANGF